jgi:PEGA domain-containing protein
MRVLFTAFVLLGAAATAAAQSHGHGLTDDMPTPSIGLPLPHIGLPLPSMGLPPATMGLPPSHLAQPSARFDRTERVGQLGRFEQSERPKLSGGTRFQRPASIVYFGWPYFPYLPADQFPQVPVPVPQVERATGTLHLVLSSGANPQIFIDGYYAGLFSEAAGELTLDAGAHTIELREEGYQSVRIPVNIQPNEVIMYNVGLLPIVTARSADAGQTAEPALPTPAPTTIYVVPGCYIGNVPPREVALPAGCDARNAVEFRSR